MQTSVIAITLSIAYPAQSYTWLTRQNELIRSATTHMRLAEDAAIMGRTDSYCFHVNAAVRYLQATPSKRFGIGKSLANFEKIYADNCLAKSDLTIAVPISGSTTYPALTTQPAARMILSEPQINAQRSANQYLRLKGFSREGLISQLTSRFGSGFSVADASIAVDSLNINWNEQSVRSAQGYLAIMGFSCNGLIQQLSSSFGEKYTMSQAAYGAKQAGVC